MEHAVPHKVTARKGTTDEESESGTPISLKQKGSNDAISPNGSQEKSAPKIKGLAHMKDAVQKHMNNLKDFRTFLKKHFKSPAEAWDVIAADVGEDGLLQHDVFCKKVKELGFEGNAEGIFKVIDENGTGITKQQLKQTLTAQKKGNAFLDLVEQAVANKDDLKGEDGNEKRKSSKEESGSGSGRKESKEGKETKELKASSPREGGRGRTSKRESSPKASKRESSPKGRASSPKGSERNQRRRASEGDAPAELPFGRTSSTSAQPQAVRGNSKGSLASMSTAASTPTHSNQVKKKGL
jgi:hypothetical protein